MTTPTLRALAILLALASSGAAQGLVADRVRESRPSPTGRVHVVDSDGGGDFVTIQEAVDAAADGDTVLVQSGLYDGFAVHGRSLTVIGERDATLLFRPGAEITVEGLAFEERVVLRGLRETSVETAGPSLAASDNAGLLWLEDCSFRSPVLDTPAAAAFSDCAGVVAVDCVFRGSDAYDVEAHGLFAERSDLYLYDCTLRTGEHYALVGGVGSDGASTVLVEDGSVFLSGCTLKGGAASNWNCPYGGGGTMSPGSGGPALELSNADAVSFDTSLEPGNGWEIFLVACGLVLGPEAVVLQSSTHTVLPGTAHRLAVASPLREGEASTVTLEGVAGESAFVHDTPTPLPIASPLFVGPLYTPVPLQILGPLAIPGSGSLAVGLTIGDLAGWRESLALYSQGLFVAGGGDNTAGAPSAVVVLDEAIQPIFSDCDGNRVEDAEDLFLGNVVDCNGNGIPDACDVALGTSADCDGNGVPDECDAVVQVQKIGASGVPVLPAQFIGDLDLDGDTIVVSPTWDDPADEALLVYVRDAMGDWPATETLRLVPSDTSFPLHTSAVKGDTILARHPGLGLFLWERDAMGCWPSGETQILTTSDPADHLNGRIHTDGGTIAAQGLFAGVPSVFVWERNPDGTWPTTETAVVSTTAPLTYLNDVAVLGDTIFASNSGKREVYAWERSGGLWPATESTVLTGDPHFFTDLFGRDLDVSGDALVVAAPSDHQDVWRSGAAYVFRRMAGVWSEETKLRSASAEENDWLTQSGAAISADAIVLHLPFRAGFPTQAAVLFQRMSGVWCERATFVGQPISPSADFGDGIAISGATIVCAGEGDVSDGRYGSAFVFELADANGNEVPDSCE